MAHLKVGLFGLAGTVATAVVTQMTAACPDLRAQWPTLLTAGVLAGFGLWLQKPKA